MTEQEKRKAREAERDSESIVHFPFPNLHLFIVTPNGTPVGELKFNRVEPDDARLDMAALDVDRLTARMGHMTRAQLTDMANQLSGIEGRLREFMTRPHPENGNGNGGKPVTPHCQQRARSHAWYTVVSPSQLTTLSNWYRFCSRLPGANGSGAA